MTGPGGEEKLDDPLRDALLADTLSEIDQTPVHVHLTVVLRHKKRVTHITNIKCCSSRCRYLISETIDLFSFINLSIKKIIKKYLKTILSMRAAN